MRQCLSTSWSFTSIEFYYLFKSPPNTPPGVVMLLSLDDAGCLYDRIVSSAEEVF